MAKGYKGGGTMKFTTRVNVKNTKNVIGGIGQRPPMENPTMGRVLYSKPGNRTGRQEGSGPQS